MILKGCWKIRHFRFSEQNLLKQVDKFCVRFCCVICVSLHMSDIILVMLQEVDISGKIIPLNTYSPSINKYFLSANCEFKITTGDNEVTEK